MKWKKALLDAAIFCAKSVETVSDAVKPDIPKHLNSISFSKYFKNEICYAAGNSG